MPEDRLVPHRAASAMSRKAVHLTQRAFAVVDNVNPLSGTSSNSCTITVKSSPPRTAKCMTQLAVKSGWMVKRNEQQTWQSRYCCIVPHTFLYYFESNDSETPRGVIDLEHYTDISEDPVTGALVLKPGLGVPQGLRTFYMRPEDGWSKAEWLSGLHRERFKVVRDERDAYMNLQACM
ncbi:unnamed protein product [Discosporangium mesarthrocarpum]